MGADRSTITRTANTFFCFSFYADNTGSTKKNYELDLLRTQLFLHASIFGCENWRVYSDVETWLSPQPNPINTVKVDVDAVFLPSRLRSYLERSNFAVTQNGIYLENCKYVNYGFFGSLEVISHNGAATYMANLDDCKGALNYLGSEKVTGNEPWGEDLFAQRCMDLHGVNKINAFDINTDASCAAWRPEGQKKNRKWRPDCSVTRTPAIHHFKTPKEYFDCLKATGPY